MNTLLSHLLTHVLICFYERRCPCNELGIVQKAVLKLVAQVVIASLFNKPDLRQTWHAIDLMLFDCHSVVPVMRTQLDHDAAGFVS